MCVRWLLWITIYCLTQCGMAFASASPIASPEASLLGSPSSSLTGNPAASPTPLLVSRVAGYSSSLRPLMAMRPVHIPQAVRPQPRLLDDALYASIAGYRALDYLSTRRVLSGGGREVELPQWVVDHSGTFMAFEGLATATEVSSSVWLIHHGHRRMARTMNMASIGIGAGTVLHNYRQPLAAPPVSALR